MFLTALYSGLAFTQGGPWIFGKDKQSGERIFLGKKVGECVCPVRTLEKKILKKEQEMFAVFKVAV